MSSTTIIKFKCNHDTCKKKIGLMVFSCPYCEKSFCLSHRMPEEHNCQKDYRALALQRNKVNIMNCATEKNKNYVSL